MSNFLIFMVWPVGTLAVIFGIVAVYDYRGRRRLRLSNEARNLRLKARWEARNGNMDESFRLLDEAANKLIEAGEPQL